ncbi:MAG: hypothetical protein WC819_06165 [Parcubacteria group bacterium]|jgi:hypothetical protein
MLTCSFCGKNEDAVERIVTRSQKPHVHEDVQQFVHNGVSVLLSVSVPSPCICNECIDSINTTLGKCMDSVIILDMYKTWINP